MKIFNIAIDGPAGAGKSTIAKVLAKKLNLTYIDTGAMYRAITLEILKRNIDLNDIALIIKTIKNTKIDIKDSKLYVNDREIANDEIRSPLINKNVSIIAQIPEVREQMVIIQKRIASKGRVIMDGRDIGTCVMPNAEYKFFLTASLDERVQRRAKELIEKGYNITLSDIVKDIKTRDMLDSQRKFSPLRKAEDAILIDTTGKTIEEVANEMILIIKGEESVI
ncbi:MAG: CMP/dCMP kinase [Thermosediminibacterales bacterium]|nr:CMP/dCMP kinase [Thermosediminibacterales bacterium]